MIIDTKLLICFLVAFYLLLSTGCYCYKDEALPIESGIQEEEDGQMTIEISSGEDMLTETGNACGNSEAIEYIGFPEACEAYLGILKENISMLTYEPLSDADFSIGGIDIGDGKIAVLDVFGDETPELLYIYNDNEDIEYGNSLYLEIFEYSAAEGAKPVFQSRVFSPAGGEDTYCVYLTRSGELMVYHNHSGASSCYGFWQIIPNQSLKITGEDGFGSYSRDLAKLYYGDGIEALYIQDGVEVSEEQFEITAKGITEDVAKVIFQGIRLTVYLYDYWKDITPFEESCMTYAEAVLFLEGQIELTNKN